MTNKRKRMLVYFTQHHTCMLIRSNSRHDRQFMRKMRACALAKPARMEMKVWNHLAFSIPHVILIILSCDYFHRVESEHTHVCSIRVLTPRNRWPRAAWSPWGWGWVWRCDPQSTPPRPGTARGNPACCTGTGPGDPRETRSRWSPKPWCRRWCWRPRTARVSSSWWCCLVVMMMMVGGGDDDDDGRRHAHWTLVHTRSAHLGRNWTLGDVTGHWWLWPSHLCYFLIICMYCIVDSRSISPSGITILVLRHCTIFFFNTFNTVYYLVVYFCLVSSENIKKNLKSRCIYLSKIP